MTRKILVVEKEEDVCCGTSKANSAIVHAGVRRGPRQPDSQAQRRGQPPDAGPCEGAGFCLRPVRQLVVCLSDEDRPALQKLYENGIANGVEGLRIIERDELVEMEPNISDAPSPHCGRPRAASSARSA